jgi:glycine cleavage system H lipoate-binding protein
LSGEIIAFNDALESSPESVNSDPSGMDDQDKKFQIWQR